MRQDCMPLDRARPAGRQYSGEADYMAILKLCRDDPQREIDFELKYLTSLTVRQRFALMLEKSADMKKMPRRRGYRKPAEIIKRT